MVLGGSILNIFVKTLCYDYLGTILGVAQLCNKKVGPYFTTFDEDVATAFGIYCCISINHVSA